MNKLKSVNYLRITCSFSLYEYFKEEVRAGRHGKTSQFWVQYMDRVWLLLRFLRATKMNDLDLHITCLQQLCPLFFSMDHHNYARYLSSPCSIYQTLILVLNPCCALMFSVCAAQMFQHHEQQSISRLNKPLTGTPKQEVVLLASAEACQLITQMVGDQTPPCKLCFCHS